MNRCRLFRHLSLRSLLLLAVLIGAGIFAGCAPDEPPIQITATPEHALTPAPEAMPTPTPFVDPLIAAAARLGPDAVGPLDFPPGVNPLTGLPVDDPGTLQRRPLAAKISNAPEIVRPQAGIAAADIVFEHYVEGALTRFTAIYWTHTPPRVGSIRSARLIDLQLPQMYGALFAYAGANAIIQQRITEQPFAPRAYEGVSVGPPLYFRDTGVEMPHNLFIVPDEVWQRSANDGTNTPPDLTGMAFDESPPVDPAAAQPATRVTVDYGPDRVEWGYDREAGLYRRTVNDAPHRDANTGAQVTAANVVVLYVPHTDDPDIVAGEWNGQTTYHTAIELWGSGTAVICRDGLRIEGTWMRLHNDGPLSFWTGPDASDLIPLKPGVTWFQVVPADFTRAWAE